MPNPKVETLVSGHRRKHTRNRRRTRKPAPIEQTLSNQSPLPSQYRNGRKSKRAAREAVTDDVEEQLRKQRLKQQQQQQQRQHHSNTTGLPPEKASRPAPRMGNYVYDEERGSYFPESSRSNNRIDIIGESGESMESRDCVHSHLHTSGSTQRHMVSGYERTSPVILSTFSELSSSVHHRKKLISCLGGKAVLERMRFTPQDSNRMFAVSLRLPRVSFDFNTVPLYSRPGWCRSFAVVEISSDIVYPMIVANYQGHPIRFDPLREKWTQIRSDRTCRSISVIEKCPHTCVLGLISGGEGANEASRLDVTVIEVGREQYSARNFAGPPRANEYLYAADGSGGLWATDYVYGRSPIFVGTEEARNHPRSGALCIEMGQSPSSSGNRTYYFGHRNGQVSLVDPRSLRCKSTCADRDLGNINAINLSMETCNLLVAQGSNGICRIFDTRQLSQSVHKLEIPFPCSKALTSQCRGVAIDPSGSLVFTPYINKKREPYFAFWNVLTGTYVGSKCLNKFQGSRQGTADALPIGVPVELDSVWTRALKCGKNGGHELVDCNSTGMELYSDETCDGSMILSKKQMGLWVRAGEDFHHLYFERP